ncbi:MAG: septum formation inhibitor Maf [Vicingaceae bacterium]
MKHILFSLAFFSLLLNACLSPNTISPQSQQFKNQSSEEFNAYWYQGKAELNSYDLTQSRYGEKRKGDAVLVFVSEDFLIDPQVKKDYPTEQPSSSVLKLNFIRKFVTGIYDYSLMSSVFTPIHQEKVYGPIKTTSSSQEWCGQSWLQLNQRSGGYEVAGYSYFQSEGDIRRVLKNHHLEDGLWNQIRIQPDLIPEGEVEMIPASQFLRLRHHEIKAYTATLSKSNYKDSLISGHKLQSLSVDYPSLDRQLEIIYEKEFPHRIKAWRESYQVGLGEKAKLMQTTATLKANIMSDYWNKNSLSDSSLRKRLRLKP